MNKKDMIDVFTIVTVALCCPFAILIPPFSDIMQRNHNSEDKGE